MLSDLESLNAFSHVINRTKRKDIGSFTIREPFTVNHCFDEIEKQFYEAVKAFVQAIYGEVANLVSSIVERSVTSSIPAFVSVLDDFIERGIEVFGNISDDFLDNDFCQYHAHKSVSTYTIRLANELKLLAGNLPKTDAKANRLLDIIDDTLNYTDSGKLLVFSFSKRTIRYLKNYIIRQGIRVGVITGDIPQRDREVIRDRFRLSKDDPKAIDVLLCSEVGSEGLDYEFCSRMVNYDIPWNPMKIEQRIGRIDRFGQKSPKVQIYNFVIEDTVEERIYSRCLDRIGVFNSTIGDLEGILGDFVQELTSVALNPNLTEKQRNYKLQQLDDNIIRLANETRQFENDSKNLFLIDIDTATEESATDEKKLQINWQKYLLKFYFNKCHEDTTFTEISDSYVKVGNFLKSDKENLFSKLSLLKQRQHKDKTNKFLKIDVKSKAYDMLMKFLNSDSKSDHNSEESRKTSSRTFFLNFDNTSHKGEQNEFQISATHPLTVLAYNALPAFNKPFISNFMIKEQNCCLDKGLYTFACYKWREFGYRTNEDILVILYNNILNSEVDISLSGFEKMILSNDNNNQRFVPDISFHESVVYQKQQEAKQRLLEITESTVKRKLTSLEEYYQREIDKLESLLDTQRDKKYKRMTQGKISKLQRLYEQRKNELNKMLQSDVFVTLFAAGSVEVV